MTRTTELLNIQAIASRLAEVNQTIIEKANGKLAPRLLSFIGKPSSVAYQEQFYEACLSLRKPGETNNPTYDEALRRAAADGRLFELKILMRTISPHDLGKQDKYLKFSALHWAVIKKHEKCAELLVEQLDRGNIEKSLVLDVQDIQGRTPLHHAVSNNSHSIIQLLVEAGASLEIEDCNGKKPCESNSVQIMTFNGFF